MKVFIVGLDQSGRTTVAERLAQNASTEYVSASGGLRSSFRSQRKDERFEDYNQAYLEFYVSRMRQNPNLFVENINDTITAYNNKNIIVDGIENPRDFFHLFDYNTDVVVFLNRVDAPETVHNYAGVGLNVMRDYCLYLSSIGLVSKTRWLEYNFKIPGEESDFVKELGKHNTVVLTKSINKAIQHLKGELCKLGMNVE